MKKNKISYCSRCCLPETVEGISFDELGVCMACKSSEEKMHIDWKKREKQLSNILIKAKSKAQDNYDCVLPISGGKDSFFQAHILTKVYGLKPLAVTFSHNWFSEIGFYNLQRCLEIFNLDQLQFTPARGLVNKIARKSIFAIGDSCWHCHSGIGAFTLQIATKFQIPLIVWGESLSETSARQGFNLAPVKFDRNYFTKVSAKVSAKDMVDETLTNKDLKPFKLPTYNEISKTKVWGIHLGNYIFWDDERQTEFIKKEYGWKESEMEGTYKRYKSVECIMSGMHDYSCYLKRGYGRATTQASVDVRNGLLTKEDAFELIKKKDSEKPEVLNYFKKITDLTEEEINRVLKGKRVKKLKNIPIKVSAKKNKHPEKLKPFVQQLIEKHLKDK